MEIRNSAAAAIGTAISRTSAVPRTPASFFLRAGTAGVLNSTANAMNTRLCFKIYTVLISYSGSPEPGTKILPINRAAAVTSSHLNMTQRSSTAASTKTRYAIRAGLRFSLSGSPVSLSKAIRAK